MLKAVPWKPRKTQVIRNGISGILRSSQHVTTSHFFQFSGFGPLDPRQQEISTEVQARSASKFFDTNATDSTQSCSTQIRFGTLYFTQQTLTCWGDSKSVQLNDATVDQQDFLLPVEICFQVDAAKMAQPRLFNRWIMLSTK